MGAGGSWNPLRVEGAALPASVLLPLKLLGLASLPSLAWYAWPVVGALLLNRLPRLAALALGATLGLGGHMLAALLAVLAAFHRRHSQPLAIEWLLAVIFLVAGGSAVSDHYWLPVQLGWPAGGVWWIPLVSLSFAAALGLFLPQWRRWGLSAAIAALALPLLRDGRAASPLVWALAAALFVFTGGAKLNLVLYDGACGFCDFSRRWLMRLDADGVFRWLPFQSGEGLRFGIPAERVRERLQLVLRQGRVLEGFLAVRAMSYQLPVVWLILFALLPWLPPVALRSSVAAIGLALSPLADCLGQAAYDWVARNRHRWFAERACRLPERG